MFASPSLFCLPPPLAPFSITSGSACKREPTRKHMWTCMRGVCVCVSLVSLSCLCLYVPGYVGRMRSPPLLRFRPRQPLPSRIVRDARTYARVYALSVCRTCAWRAATCCVLRLLPNCMECESEYDGPTKYSCWGANPHCIPCCSSCKTTKHEVISAAFTRLNSECGVSECGVSGRLH